MLTIRKIIPLVALLLTPACDDKSKDSGAAKTDAKAGDAKAGDAKAGDTKAGDTKDPDAKPSGPPLPALDTANANKAVAALEGAPEDARPLLAAAALAELERARLGDSFVEGLEALTKAAPDQRPMLLAKSIQSNIDMLNAACVADGAKTMQSLATRDPSSRDDALWDACKFEDLGLITREDAKGTDAIAVLIAHMAYAKIKAHGAVDPAERTLLLELAKVKTDAG